MAQLIMCTHDNNKTSHIKIFLVYQPFVSSNTPPINFRFFALGSVLKVSYCSSYNDVEAHAVIH